MTATEFVRRIAIEAKKQPQRVIAVDFEPHPDGLHVTVTFRYA